MPLPAITAPTTAERVRTACRRAGQALLAADGARPEPTPVHHLLADGSFAVMVPADGVVAEAGARCGAGGEQAVLELTDYAPLPLREPVRALVWIRSRLHAVAHTEVRGLLDLIATEDANPALLQVGSDYTLLRLEVESVVVADASGAESVGTGALLAARPDPFCAVEAARLQHLDSDHPDVVARLAAKLPPVLRRGRVRPLGLDRYGVRLRIENPDGDHDVRLPFPTPVHDMTALGRAIRVLMGCPFVNGLRARRL